MARLQFLIGKLMLTGAFIAASLTFIGAAMYLWNHGSETIHFHYFNPKDSHASSLISARGIIELGLYILVLTQILRVALTTWLFIKAKDKWFIGFSLFILGVLIYSFLV